MDVKQSTLRQPRYRTVIVSGCLGIAICLELGAAVAEGRRLLARPASVQMANTTSAEACLPRLYAYLNLEIIAEDLGSDGDMLVFALDDLRASLMDCLADRKNIGEVESSSENTARGEGASLRISLNSNSPLSVQDSNVVKR